MEERLLWCDGSSDRGPIEPVLVPASGPIKAMVCAILFRIKVHNNGAYKRILATNGKK